MLRFFFATGKRIPVFSVPLTAPVYAQLAAAHDHANIFVEYAKAPPKGDRRTRAGSACQRLTRPPLVDAEADVRAADNFHEPDIHAIREAGVAFYCRTEPLHGGGVDR